MATPVRELITRLVFQVDKGSADRADAAGESAKKAGEKAAEGWTNFTARIGLAIDGLKKMGGIAKTVFATLITNFATQTDEAAKTARAVGVTVGQLQELNFAATLSGASNKDVSNALTKLAVGAREASKGTKTFKEAFGDLGVEFVDGNGKIRQTNALMLDVADRFKGMTDGSEKTAIAVKLFGKSGAALVPFLSEGRDGLQKMGKTARGLGVIVDNTGAKIAENFNDKLFLAQSALKGVRNRISLAVLPKLTELAEKFAAWASDSDRVGKALEVVKLGAKVLGSVLATMAATHIAGVIAAMGRWVVGLFAVDAANKKTALSTRLLGGALGLLKATGILLIAAALQDLFKLATGGKSEIGKALGPEGAKDMKRILVELGATFKTLLKELAPVLADLLKSIAPLIPILAKIAAVIGKTIAFGLKLIVSTIKVITGKVDGLKNAWRGVGDVVRAIFGGIRTAWAATVGKLVDGISWVIRKLEPLKVVGKILAAPFKAIGVVIDALRSAFQWILDKADQVRVALGLTKFTATAGRLNLPAGSAAATATAPATRPEMAAPAGPTNFNVTNNISGAGLNSDELANRIGTLSEQTAKRLESEKLRQAAAAIGR